MNYRDYGSLKSISDTPCGLYYVQCKKLNGFFLAVKCADMEEVTAICNYCKAPQWFICYFDVIWFPSWVDYIKIING